MQLNFTDDFHQTAWHLLNSDTSIYCLNAFSSFSMPDTTADAINLHRQVSSNCLAVTECRYKYLFGEFFQQFHYARNCCRCTLIYSGEFHQTDLQLLNADTSIYCVNTFTFSSFSMSDSTADATKLPRGVSSNSLASAEFRYKYLLFECF